MRIQNIVTEYDGNNNPIRIIETKFNTLDAAQNVDICDMEYDLLDRLTRNTQRGHVINYVYDDNGNRLNVSSSGGNTAYKYDDRNRLISATTENGTSTYTYSGDSKKLSVVYPNNTVTRYTYDNADRVLSVVNEGTGISNEGVISSFFYGYDVNSNRVSQVEMQNGFISSQAQTTTYSYDNTNRMTGYSIFDQDTQSTKRLEYGYDKNYNRVSEVETSIIVSSTDEGTEETTIESIVKNQTSIFDANNRLVRIIDNLDSQDGTIDYVYDNNGNTLVKRDNTQVTPQITRFIYDSRNQLSQTVRGPPLSEVNLGYYDYNYMGDRVRHLVSDRGDIEYIYDGKSVLEERSLSNTNLVAHYRYSDRLISLNTGNDEQYYHYSAQRTTVNLSNGSGNTLVSYRTDVWGRVTQQEGNSTNRHIFTGQEHDSNTGLIYFGARFYDPDTARFINEDSYLGESSTAPSLHRYLYAYANPALYYDPTGHAALIGEIGQFLMDTSATLLNQVDEDAGLIETAFYGFTGGVTGLLGGIFGTANFAANLVTSTPIFSDRVRREANEELDGVFGQVHYILNNKKAFANQVASSVGSTLGDAAKGNSNAIAKIIASGVGFLGTKGQNSILSASRTATVVSASRSVTNSIRQSKLISSAKSTIERAISSGGNRISVASKSAAGGKSSSHMNLRALLTSRFGKGDNGDVPNRGRKATADSRPIQVSGITNDLDVSLLRLDGQSIINNPFLSRVRSQLNKYDVGVNYRYGDVSHRNLGKATQHLDGRIDIDIYKQNAFSSKDSLRTYVHESSHAVAAARGRKIGTVADEYHAFRREFLFINNRRPKFNERKTLYNEVKKLYDDVPIGDTPRLFRK